MYNGLLYAVKRRILDETEAAFSDYPAFSKKVVVRNKFPYEERLQYGVVLRNASGSLIRMSPDNFLSDLFSLTTVVTDPYYPGTSIEWVREDEGYVTRKMYEDVSFLFDGTVRVFQTSYPILKGRGNTEYSDSPGQVEVKINGVPIVPEKVEGERNIIWLYRAPAASDKVEVNYLMRNIVPPGLFTVDFAQNFAAQGQQFSVSAEYIIENETVIERTTGTEAGAQLDHQNLVPGHESIVLGYTDNQGRISTLKRVDDYNINYSTGVISFVQPLEKNYALYADYRYVPTNFPSGPYTFKEFQENSDAIPGVILSIGRRFQQGDQQVVRVSKTREQQAQIYGGHWEMSLDLAVISKDAMQMEQMADRVVEYFWAVRKNELEKEGLTLNSVEPSGESEEMHIDATGDLYYESSVSINIMSEWQLFKPYTPIMKINDIIVTPSLNPVFSGPVVGYERLT